MKSFSEPLMKSFSEPLMKSFSEPLMKRKAVAFAVFMLVFMVLFSSLLPGRAIACVGRMLSLGIINTEDHRVMAEMLSTLISESTGTTVNIVTFKSLEEAREAMKREELDLYLDYVCSGLIYVLQGERAQVENSGKAYSMVKHLSDKKFSMIWLKPFGYANPTILNKVPEEMRDIPNQAVCVARRGVLNRFPILPRLINKLNDKVSNETIKELQQQPEMKTAVKAFLEERKMIRWAIP